jgi:hypothetical protein
MTNEVTNVERRREPGRREEDKVLSPETLLRIGHVRSRTQEVFINGDATTIRVLLAWGSFFWALVLWWPTVTFNRQAYTWMAYVAPEWVWGLAFILHWLGVIWRVYDPKPRVHWALGINAFGAFLWTFMEGCLFMSLGELSPSRALDWCVIVAAWVALARTGLNEGKGSP